MLDDYQPKPRRLWLVALVFCVVVIADSCFRWATYQYRTFDLAFYVHSFWLALHGQSHSTILDVSLMGNHAEPICFLLMPLFWIWKHPMFFVVIQAALVATMPFTAYRIARRMEFERRGALRLALATLLAPATGYMVLHEFHPETLSAPLILLMLEARFASRVGLFWVWFLLSIACKENVALLIGWLCAVHYVLDRGRSRDWQLAFNVVPGAIALGWVLLYGLWVGPALNGGRVDYYELYGHVGGLKGMFTSPGTTFAAAWNAATTGTLVWGLVAPLLLLPLLRPRWLIIAAPIFAQHLLSSRPSEWSIYFHYAAPLIPLIWYGAAEACARLYWRDVMAGWVVAACVAFQLWIGPVHSVFRTITTASEARENAKIRSDFLAAIPDEASVVANLRFLSHLAMREKVYSLHHILKGLKTLSRTEYVPPPPTDAVVVDVADSATFDRAAGYYHPAMKAVDGRLYPESEVLLDTFLKNATWSSISRNEITLLRREDSQKSGRPIVGEGRELDPFHRLISAESIPPTAGDSGLIVLNLEVKPNRPIVPWVRLYLQAEDGRQYSIAKGPIGLGRPTGPIFTESWAVRPPSSIPRGKYRSLLLFYDNHESIYPGKARFEKRTFDLGDLDVR